MNEDKVPNRKIYDIPAGNFTKPGTPTPCHRTFEKGTSSKSRKE